MRADLFMDSIFQALIDTNTAIVTTSIFKSLIHHPNYECHNHPLWYSFSFFTEIVALVGICYILFISLLHKTYWNNPEFISFIFNILKIILCGMIVALIRTEVWWHWSGRSLYYTTFYPTELLITTPLTVIMKFFVLIFTLICVILHQSYFTKLENAWEYSILILILAISMLLIISSNDLMMAFLSLELQSLTLYIFLAIRRYSNLSMEATIKYFIYSAFASASFVYGVSLIYGLFATTNFGLLYLIMPTLIDTVNPLRYMAILGSILIFVGLLFKLTLAPFYFWAGDVYHGSHGYVGSYLAIVAKIPTWVLLVKLLYIAFEPVMFVLLPLLKIVAIASIAVSSFYALTELNFKRFWALSSVGHMGYILLAVTIYGTTGLTIAFFYLLIYITATVFIWALVMHLVKNPQPDLLLKEFLIKLSRFISLRKTRLLLVVPTILILFSLAGIPPGMGFLPKAYLFYAIYKQNDLFIFLLVFCLNLISLGYYLRLSRFLLFEADLKKEPRETFFSLPKNVVWIMVFMFIINILFSYCFVEVINYLFVDNLFMIQETENLVDIGPAFTMVQQDPDSFSNFGNPNYKVGPTHQLSIMRKLVVEALRASLEKDS